MSGRTAELYLWFEDAFTSWLGGTLVLAAAGTVALLNFLEIIDAKGVAWALMLGLTLAVLLACFRAVARSKHPLKSTIWGLAILAAAVANLPARELLSPGQPTRMEDVRLNTPGIELKHGPARILVSHPFGTASQGHVSYRLEMGTQLLEGSLDRSVVTSSSRRGGVRHSVQDHSTRAHDVDIPADGTPLKLAFLEGTSDEYVTVRIYHALPDWVWYALAALLVLASVILDALLGAKNTLAIIGVGVAAFGAFMRSADPNAASGAVFGSAIAGAMVGAVGGPLLAWVLRKFVKPPLADEKALAKPGK